MSYNGYVDSFNSNVTITSYLPSAKRLVFFVSSNAGKRCYINPHLIVEYTKTTDQATIELPAMLSNQNTDSFSFDAQTISASAATASIASAENVEFENMENEDA